MSIASHAFASHRRDRGARPPAITARAASVLVLAVLAVFAAATLVGLEFGDRLGDHRDAPAASAQPAGPFPEAAAGDPATRMPDPLHEGTDPDLAGQTPMAHGG